MAYKFQMTDAILSGTIAPQDDNSFDLGVVGAEWKDIHMDGTLYAASSSFIGSTMHMNGASTFASTIVATGSITAGTSFIIGSADLNETDMEKLDGITDGTGAANKALVLDGSRDVDNINAIGIASMANNWTNAGRTVADLGVVTTVDINGGSMDGVTIGAASAAAATVSSLSVSDGNITNVGDIALDSISADGSSFSFGSDWTAASRTCADLGIVTSGSIRGGSVDGTVIGLANAAAGYFTTLSATGDVDLGDATSDTITATGRFDSDLVPSSDSARDLGTSALQWAELHCDAGYIDAITVSGVSALQGITATSFSGSSTLEVVGNSRLGGNLAVSGTVELAGVADTAAALASDSFYFKDADGLMKSESMADYASSAAGVGLSAASGVFALDLNELSDAALASGDKLSFVDATDNSSKLDTVDDLATLFAGNGLSAASAVLALDLNELTAAAVDVGADSIAIVDANDSNATKKESIADLVSAMAGAGLTATNGVLSSDASPTPTNHGDANGTLAEGMNFSGAAFSAARTWTLPASPDAGDVVTVKAPSNAATYELTVARAGSQTIDGETSVVLMSDNGAIELVYLGSDKWAIK